MYIPHSGLSPQLFSEDVLAAVQDMRQSSAQRDHSRSSATETKSKEGENEFFNGLSD